MGDNNYHLSSFCPISALQSCSPRPLASSLPSSCSPSRLTRPACLPASTSSLQFPAASALSYSELHFFHHAFLLGGPAQCHTHCGVPKTRYTILPSSATASCVLHQFCISSASVCISSASVLHQSEPDGRHLRPAAARPRLCHFCHV